MAALALSVLTPAVAMAQATPPGAHRVSASVELERVEPLMKRLARIFESGFGAAEAARMVREIDELPVNREGDFRFDVTFGRAPAMLRIRVVVDELSMADLDFTVTSPGAAARIRAAVDEVTGEDRN
jgi:hypothetical protein